MVECLCVQRENDGCHLGSPSGLHDNLGDRLHLGRNGDLLHIHTHRHGRNRPLAGQRGLSSPPLHLLVGMDPTQMGVFYGFIPLYIFLFFFFKYKDNCEDTISKLTGLSGKKRSSYTSRILLSLLYVTAEDKERKIRSKSNHFKTIE